MSNQARIYHSLLRENLAAHRQMAFVSGPRQVGKTTVCRDVSDTYLNWDNAEERRVILSGTNALGRALGLYELAERRPVITFDELHKHPKWKSVLKGLFDSFGDKARFVVTGSARLNIYRRGGDSLMGRYLLYRMHPWSVAECLHVDVPDDPVRPPAKIADEDWAALETHGGFPEPFLKRDLRFTRRWRHLRHEQLSKEDLRECTEVRELGTVEILMRLLAERSGGALTYSNLANELGAAVNTVKQWVDLLERLHYGFLVRPWFRNVAKALRREPKWYLRDWSGLEDSGARAETLMACHLLKTVEGWTDIGLGTFELFYLRDKMKREVDFLVTHDGKPWFLVEVKKAERDLSAALAYFQQQTGAPHAFQAVLDMPFENADCFAHTTPVVVPARTLLSQLL